MSINSKSEKIIFEGMNIIFCFKIHDHPLLSLIQNLKCQFLQRFHWFFELLYLRPLYLVKIRVFLWYVKTNEVKIVFGQTSVLKKTVFPRLLIDECLARFVLIVLLFSLSKNTTKHRNSSLNLFSLILLRFLCIYLLNLNDISSEPNLGLKKVNSIKE